MYCCSIDVGEEKRDREYPCRQGHVINYEKKKKKLPCHIFYTVYFQIGEEMQ